MIAGSLVPPPAPPAEAGSRRYPPRSVPTRSRNPRVFERSLCARPGGMERNAEKQWEITFENVGEPERMKARLESSPFFKKCNAPKAVQIAGTDVVFSFPSTLDRQGVLKKCGDTFKQYSPYQRHHVVKKGSLHHATRAGLCAALLLSAL